VASTTNEIIDKSRSIG